MSAAKDFGRAYGIAMQVRVWLANNVCTAAKIEFDDGSWMKIECVEGRRLSGLAAGYFIRTIIALPRADGEHYD